MANMRWTPAQEAAIYDRGGSLLLSAAAGSGKTAVLTERVVQMLRDTAHPVQADRLLIVTFTNAAAAELRARISARIEQVLMDEPLNNHLRRQKMLLQRANICTIDAFCLQLVQQHFTALDIPPDFALADGGVVEKLKNDALAETLEQAYQDPDFCDFVNMYGKGRSDAAASAAILQLYDFLRTEPNEEHFLSWIEQQWSPGNLTAAQEVCDALAAEVGSQVALGSHFAKTALSLCQFDFEDDVAFALESKKTQVAKKKAEARVTEKYQKILAVMEEIVDAFAALAPYAKHPVDWDKLYAAFQPYREGLCPMPGLVGRGVRLTGASGVRAKQAVDKASAIFEKVFDMMPCTLSQDRTDRFLAYPKIVALCAAQRHFAAIFYQKKREKKVLEFSDLEQLTLQLLRWEDGVPTPLARGIAAQFDAVMVDEYQDTNRLQDLIYHRLASPSQDNLFFVGDIKQSIYRFRKADPSIFGAKLAAFPLLGEEKARCAPPEGMTGKDAMLALDANFRSTAAVVGGINFIFEELMNDILGGTQYGDGQRLVCQSGSEFEGSANLLIDPDGGQDPDQIADKIVELIALGAQGDAAGMVRDGSTLRPVRYEDCCILLSTRAPFATYAAALAARGISVYADSAEDLLSASHIQPLVALLQIIDNPAQDIPLAAAMLSVIFGFTEDDLLALRLRQRKGSLYGALVKVAAEVRKAGDTAPADPFGQKILAFYETLSALRRVSHTLAPEELLAEIFATTHYLAVVGAMENGARRREDVAKFASYVASAGANGMESLVHHIEQTKTSGGLVDSAPGRAKPGCVTIMTIHRSKGLQFPVVFVADLSHRFNTDELKRKMLLHPVFGLGLQLRAGEDGGNYHTLLSTILRQRTKQEIYSESMRLLYVALTRAQDHLYLCGTAKKIDKKLLSMAYNMEGDLYLLTRIEDCLDATCFMDWVLRALLRHPHCPLLRAGIRDVSLTLGSADYPFAVTFYQPAEQAVVLELLGEDEQTAVSDPALVQRLVDGFDWKYARAALTALPAKVSVTSLVHKEQGTILARPAFLAKDGMTAAEKGTALHAFLENANFDAFKALPRGDAMALQTALSAEVQRQVDQQRMAPELAEQLDLESVTAFFAGEVFQRIAAAQAVYREYDFITGVPANLVLAATAAQQKSGDDKHASSDALHAGLPTAQGAQALQNAADGQGGDAVLDTATVLVQGIADLVLVYPDHVELLDYKSDHHKKAADYRTAYAQQLAYYARAIEKRFAPLQITYKAIYSFDLAQLIEV